MRHERDTTYHFSSWFTVYARLLDRFDTDRYLTGREATGCEQFDDRVRVDFADGTSIEADLLARGQRQDFGVPVWFGLDPDGRDFLFRMGFSSVTGDPTSTNAQSVHLSATRGTVGP